MAITINAEIHFHQPEIVSVFRESNAPPSFEPAFELEFFAMFASAQMRRLGRSGVGDALANLLKDLSEMIPALASGFEPGDDRLVDYIGSPGRKQFIARLEAEEGLRRFTVKDVGFESQMEGFGYYAPTSATILLRFLARKWRAESPRLTALAHIAKLCGAAHFDDKPSRSSCIERCVFLAADSIRYSDSEHGWSEMRPPVNRRQEMLARLRRVGPEKSLWGIVHGYWAIIENGHYLFAGSAFALWAAREEATSFANSRRSVVELKLLSPEEIILLLERFSHWTTAVPTHVLVHSRKRSAEERPMGRMYTIAEFETLLAGVVDILFTSAGVQLNPLNGNGDAART